MLEIEDGLPIPPRSDMKYPFSVMQVGQSFFCPHEGRRAKVESAVRGSMRMQKIHGRAFVSRTVGNGIRVWRTA